ncbi:MAG: DUF5989 family protein [Patescibacteria group bacterium]
MFKDLWSFLMENKKWWLIPPVIIFTIFGLLIVFSSSNAVSPFIYMIF